MSDERDGGIPEEDDPIELEIGDAIDLHTFHPRDVRGVVEDYVEAARDAGFTEVRIIHGRGIGVQRDAVRKVLSRLEGVASFADAPPERGGWGATVVALAPREAR